MSPTQRLKRRADFLQVAGLGRKAPMPGLVLQALPRGDGAPARLGFTVTRKVGNAVVRNRCKRRLREAARITLPLYGRAGCDYVFVARGGTARREWLALVDDMKSALLRLAAEIDGARAS